MPTYHKKTIEDIALDGKKALVRCDFNVPLSDGVITDDKRIVAALPTVRYLLAHGAAVILCSHLGRPKNGPEEKFSMKPVAVRLSELLGMPVALAADVVGPDAAARAAALKPGEVLLLENVRFEKGETKNDPELSKKLAALADLFVNDAFGTAHRAHCSTAGVADYLKTAVSGFLIKKELEIMGGALDTPKRPFVAILGGAKVSDKIGVIESLLDKADSILIGGGMAYTFFKAQGREIGSSICEAEKLDVARSLLEKAREKGSPCFCRSIMWLRTPFRRRPAQKPFPPTESPRAGWGWISAPRPAGFLPGAIQKAGTVMWNGRWESSRWLPLPREPARWHRRWPIPAQ